MPQGAARRLARLAGWVALLGTPFVAGDDACASAQIARDPHIKFAHGGRADFRGKDGQLYCFLSAPGLAVNVKTEDAAFTLHHGRLRVDGSFITEVHLAAIVGGAKRKQAFATYWASELNAFNTGWRFVNGSCGGRAFQIGLAGHKVCEELNVSVGYSTATWRVRGWIVKIRGGHVYDRISGPAHRLDISFSAEREAARANQPHGIIGQSFASSAARYGRIDTYPAAGTFRTEAMAEGAIEGEANRYEVPSSFATEFTFSRFRSAPALAAAPPPALPTTAPAPSTTAMPAFLDASAVADAPSTSRSLSEAGDSPCAPPTPSLPPASPGNVYTSAVEFAIAVIDARRRQLAEASTADSVQAALLAAFAALNVVLFLDQIEVEASGGSLFNVTVYEATGGPTAAEILRATTLNQDESGQYSDLLTRMRENQGSIDVYFASGAEVTLTQESTCAKWCDPDAQQSTWPEMCSCDDVACFRRGKCTGCTQCSSPLTPPAPPPCERWCNPETQQSTWPEMCDPNYRKGKCTGCAECVQPNAPPPSPPSDPPLPCEGWCKPEVQDSTWPEMCTEDFRKGKCMGCPQCSPPAPPAPPADPPSPGTPPVPLLPPLSPPPSVPLPPTAPPALPPSFPSVLQVPPSHIDEEVGETVEVEMLAKPAYLIHCKAGDGAFKDNWEDKAKVARIADLLVDHCQMLAQAPLSDAYYPWAELRNISGGKIRIIGYGKSNQYEGSSVWVKDLPGWTSPSTGLHDTYVEWVERTQKLNGVRYTYTGLLEKAVSATNKHVYVYVTADEWRHFYFDRGGGCGLRGLNLLPSTTHLNTSACSWYNYRAKSRYVEACGWGDNPETDVPCADTIVSCDADKTTMNREYVYFVRVEEELMRVIDMDPPPLNDSAWQNVKDKMKLKDTYHSTQPAWDSTYTNGGTGLLARVFAWDASALEEDSSERLVKPQFWTTATPFYEERLVGSTDRDGFKHADDWSRILGLTSEQSSAMLVELSGKLVVPGSGPVKFSFKCHSGCNVYLDGASLTEGPVLDGSQNVKGMQMTAGVYDWRIEFVKRPSDASDPTLSFIVRNSTTGVETNHVETFGPGARSFRVRVKVERGIDGSTAAAHPEGAVVTSPLYKGSSSNTCSAGHPDGGATKLIYYAEKTEEGMTSWGDVLAANMQDSPGIDGWYYDSSGFSLPSFNMGDTKGRKARPWNFDTNAPLTDDENFLAYEVQYSTMQKVAHEVTGRYPIFVANGNGPRYNDTVFDSFLFPGGIIPAGIFGHTEAGFKRYGNILSSARDVLVD